MATKNIVNESKIAEASARIEKEQIDLAIQGKKQIRETGSNFNRILAKSRENTGAAAVLYGEAVANFALNHNGADGKKLTRQEIADHAGVDAKTTSDCILHYVVTCIADAEDLVIPHSYTTSGYLLRNIPVSEGDKKPNVMTYAGMVDEPTPIVKQVIRLYCDGIAEGKTEIESAKASIAAVAGGFDSVAAMVAEEQKAAEDGLPAGNVKSDEQKADESMATTMKRIAAFSDLNALNVWLDNQPLLNKAQCRKYWKGSQASK